MSTKWMGAVFVLVSCGGFGAGIAGGYRRRERLLRQLMNVLENMEAELGYHLIALPELTKQAAGDAGGILRDVFLNLTRELSWQAQPDASGCMYAAMEQCHDLPSCLRRPLVQLGQTLGRFDLEGQIQGLEAARDTCRRELSRLEKNRDVRLRSYQTLGLCAGAALVILFL